MKLITLIVSALVVALSLPQPTKAHEYHAQTNTLQPIVQIAPEKPTPVVLERVRQANPTVGHQEVRPVSPQANAQGLQGRIGYAIPTGNCVNQVPKHIRPNGNPSTWSVTTRTPYLGAVVLFRINHTGIVTGIWSNGDVEVGHENYRGGKTRFSQSELRGYR